MPDPTNDIDALLTLLAKFGWERYHATAKALVAERNALRDRVDALRDRVDALRKRIAELESQEFTLPHDPFRDADRDLRERLVCAIWPQILHQYRASTTPFDPFNDARADAVIEADKMIAAMRKGEA